MDFLLVNPFRDLEVSMLYVVYAVKISFWLPDGWINELEVSWGKNRRQEMGTKSCSFPGERISF